MSGPLSTSVDPIALYLTAEHECSYLASVVARTLLVAPNNLLDWVNYQNLLSIGFRRSGDYVYRPGCTNCAACISVRVPVADFEPRRTQRRCWQRNSAGLEVVVRPPEFNTEHYNLYQRYTAARHNDGGMANLTSAAYLEFLTTRWCPTLFVEFRHHERLLAVAITDVLPNSLSAMYTFFDPEQAQQSPGVLTVLWQISEAQRRGLKYLYLGYWIQACQKMRYKDQYRPLEAWNGQRWQRYAREDAGWLNLRLPPYLIPKEICVQC